MKGKISLLREKYKKLIMPIALIGGFFIDILTLNRIDQVFDNLILITHIIIVATSITLLFSQGTKFGERFLTQKRKSFLKALMIFSFGALFSGFVIFYTRSGSLTTSWPFLASMLILMLGTEFRKKYFHRLVLQIVVFYLALLAWANFFVPVVVKKIGPEIFILSTIISTLIIFFFIEILRQVNRQKVEIYEKPIIIRIIALFIVFNILYFTRVIPPVPLSMKFRGVYYDIQKTQNGYKAQYEKIDSLNIFKKRSRIMYWKPGEDIYVFSQVFAPTKIGTSITHVWQYYDEPERKWRTSDTITIPITGGRQDGYRFFSKKQNLSYKRWRVKTITEQNQRLGIINFVIIPYTQGLPILTAENL